MNTRTVSTYAKVSLALYLCILLISFGHSVYTKYQHHTGRCQQTHEVAQICRDITTPLKTDGFQTDIALLGIILFAGILYAVQTKQTHTGVPTLVIPLFTDLFSNGILHPKAP